MTPGTDRELDGVAFDRLLHFLDADSARAGERYVQLRDRLVRLFQWRGAKVPEELADETMNRVGKKLAQGVEIEAPDPYRYFTGVAHLVFLEVLRHQDRERKALEEVRHLPLPEPISDPEEKRLQCLERCLEALPDEQRSTVMTFHAGERGHRIAARKNLAKRLAISSNALRIRVHRLRMKLEACVRACLAKGETNSAGSSPTVEAE